MAAVTDTLLHIAPRDRWLQAAETGLDYRDPSLDDEGFIHCSTRAQVLIPANERFAGRNDLVLLVIDPTLVAAEVIYEDCYDSGHAFPHIYGPVPIAAVTAVFDFPANADGTFDLPEALDPDGS